MLATVYVRVKLRPCWYALFYRLALFGLGNIQTLCLLLTNLEMYLKERVRLTTVCKLRLSAFVITYGSEITVIVNGYIYVSILWVPADIYICNV